MLKSLLVATLLAVLLLTSNDASAQTPSAPGNPSNIGFVLYTKSHAPGTLNARWIYGSKYRGSGIATGGPKDGYVGKYHVRYFLENGDFSDEYELVIEKSGDVYTVSWITGGHLSATGVGMEVEDGLAFGWRRVAD